MSLVDYLVDINSVIGYGEGSLGLSDVVVISIEVLSGYVWI